MYSRPEVAVGELGAVIVDDQLASGFPGFVGFIAAWWLMGRGAGIRGVLRKQLFAAREPLL
jgi:hypothetical protein